MTKKQFFCVKVTEDEVFFQECESHVIAKNEGDEAVRSGWCDYYEVIATSEKPESLDNWQDWII